MTRIALVISTILSFTLYSCSKDSKDPEETPDNRPLQLVKKIIRSEALGQIYTDSVGYTYDTAGHITAIVDVKSNLPRRKIIYDGDNVVAFVDFYANGQADTIKNCVKLLDGGNSILIDYSRPNPNGGVDTTQITYKWSGNQLLEINVYLSLANLGFPSRTKYIISYNASGNQNEYTEITPNGTSYLRYRGLAYDQKKNFFSTTSRLNYIMLAGSYPGQTRSVNNPIKAEIDGGYGGVQEYLWTYNEDDYPLTMQIKGKNYLSLELYYNK